MDTVKTLIIEGRTFSFPWLDAVRPHTAAEARAMAESVSRLKIRSPILLDETDNVIDGTHRLVYVKSFQIPLCEVPFTTLTGLSPEEKEALAWQLNEARRQMTPEDLEAAAVARRQRVQEAHANGRSLREIADEEDISTTQAHRDLHQDDPPEPEIQEGPFRGTPVPRDTSMEIDGAGLMVPEDLKPAWASLPLFQRIILLSATLASEVDALAKRPGGEQLRRRLLLRGDQDSQRFVDAHLEGFIAAIRDARPHASVCPWCLVERGRIEPTCVACHGAGWVTEFSWKQASPQLKEQVLARRGGKA